MNKQKEYLENLLIGEDCLEEEPVERGKGEANGANMIKVHKCMYEK
jgi:hypothetical protein